MKTIKAIETKYKGYRFRSRLEARWAVFFDALGLEWEYEPEGFDLGDGVWYLPDFRVKSTDDSFDYRWFEVKGGINNLTLPEFDKFYRLSMVNRVTILDGAPSVKSYLTAAPHNHAAVLKARELCVGKEGSLRALLRHGYLDREVLLNSLKEEMPSGDGRAEWVANRLPYSMYTISFSKFFGGKADTSNAIIEARSARFEHGEAPQ